MLRHKFDALQTFINFNTHVELQLGHPIRAIQTDWGGEFRAFTNFLQTNGISHHVSCLNAHQQNGVASSKKN